MPRAKKVEEGMEEVVAEAKKPKRAAKKQEEVQEAPAAPEVMCGFAVTMTEDGDIAFRPFGTNPNLVTLDGLLKYAERYLDREWAPRLQAPAQQ